MLGLLVTAPRESAPGAPEELRVIVQKKTLLELGRLLGEPGDEVTFEKGENHLFFRFADRVLVFDGAYGSGEESLRRALASSEPSTLSEVDRSSGYHLAQAPRRAFLVEHRDESDGEWSRMMWGRRTYVEVIGEEFQP